MSLANGLSILFIFLKNQFLVLLIFAMVSFVPLSFISALIFMISFLLLTLGFFISSFSSCFRCRVRLFKPVCETAKETQMYRTVFWTLWERERVG